jgi:hypothetical protein
VTEVLQLVDREASVLEPEEQSAAASVPNTWTEAEMARLDMAVGTLTRDASSSLPFANPPQEINVVGLKMVSRETR